MSNANSEMRDDSAPVEVVEKPFQKRGFRGKRGRPSAARRQEQHRKVIGEAFEKKRRADLSSRLYHDLDDDLDAALAIYGSKLDVSVSQIPVSTRGLGFGVAVCYKRIHDQYPAKIGPLCSVYQAYRAVLAQAALKYVMGRESVPKRRLATIPTLNAPVDAEIASMIRGHSSSFTLAANAIEALGYAEIGGVVFQPLIPPIRRRLGAFVLDPMSVTYWTLEETVTCLQNPDYPEAIRRRFIRHNPLPGAIYADDLLVNPEEVCPPGWPTHALVDADFAAYEALLMYARSRSTGLVSGVSYTGTGCGSFLVTRVATRGRIEGRIPALSVDLPSDTYLSTVKVPEQVFGRGFLALMNERSPDDGFPNQEYAVLYQINDWGEAAKWLVARWVSA